MRTAWSRMRSRAANTPLLANRMAASVNSATGTALAAAAEVTAIPRAQTAGVTISFTVPAA